MPLSRRDWHKRYTQQVRWTRDLRAYLYPRVGLGEAKRLLDVGCGTGALLGELQSQSQAQVFGLDVRRAHLGLAQNNQDVLLSQGDAHQLPFPKHTFDITLCHFTLMWLDDPKAALTEMARVTAPNGVVMALAEPDYGGRIDYPPELEQLGKLQLESLQKQGADPFMGRKIAGLFNQAGLKNVEAGVLGAQWTGPLSPEEIELEWMVFESDVEQTSRDFESLKILRESDESAWACGERVLYVPTFYAIGWR